MSYIVVKNKINMFFCDTHHKYEVIICCKKRNGDKKLAVNILSHLEL